MNPLPNLLNHMFGFAAHYLGVKTCEDLLMDLDLREVSSHYRVNWCVLCKQGMFGGDKSCGALETSQASPFFQEVVEDWMSVSFWLPHSAEAQIPMTIPEAVEQLGHDTDGIRWQSVPSLSTVSNRDFNRFYWVCLQCLNCSNCTPITLVTLCLDLYRQNDQEMCSKRWEKKRGPVFQATRSMLTHFRFCSSGGVQGLWTAARCTAVRCVPCAIVKASYEFVWWSHYHMWFRQVIRSAVNARDSVRPSFEVKNDKRIDTGMNFAWGCFKMFQHVSKCFKMFQKVSLWYSKLPFERRDRSTSSRKPSSQGNGRATRSECDGNSRRVASSHSRFLGQFTLSILE